MGKGEDFYPIGTVFHRMLPNKYLLLRLLRVPLDIRDNYSSYSLEYLPPGRNQTPSHTGDLS